MLSGKIGLEEHFALELDVSDRLTQMDALGIETLILSLNAPVVQAVFPARAGGRNGALTNCIMELGPTASCSRQCTEVLPVGRP